MTTPPRSETEQALDRFAARTLMHLMNMQRLRPTRPAAELLRDAQKRARAEVLA